MCVHSWARGAWSWVLSVREPHVALENGSGFKAERPWVFAPILTLCPATSVPVVEGGGSRDRGWCGWSQGRSPARAGKKEAEKNRCVFPQRKAESDFEATEGESLRK